MFFYELLIILTEICGFRLLLLHQLGAFLRILIMGRGELLFTDEKRTELIGQVLGFGYLGQD